MTALSESQKYHLRSLLEDRKRVLAAELLEGSKRIRDESFQAMDGGVPDAGDLSSADHFATLNASALDRDAQELRDVDSALERLATPDFGLCVDCREPIGFARLAAYPSAHRCMACQEAYEKRHPTTSARSL